MLVNRLRPLPRLLPEDVGEPNRDEYWEELVDMEFVDGATVMEVIGKLMTVLGRPIKADERGNRYDERDEED